MPARRARLLTVPAVLTLTASFLGCSNASGSAPDLVRAGCPAEIRILTDSAPRVELGALYGLLGEDPLVRVGDRSASAPLVAHGERTGVRLTIVAGDSAGDSPTNELLYATDDYLLALVDADRAIVDAARYPTVGIFAPLDRDPRIVLWDAETYPGIRTIAEIGISYGADGMPVRVLGSKTDLALDFLVGSRLLREEQAVPEYDGTATAFLAAQGQIAQQGDLTVEPRLIPLLQGGEHPIRYQTLEEAGYPRYRSMVSARPDDVSRFADCFRALVPILQQATVDFLAEPERTTAVIVDLAAKFGASPDYNLDAATQAVEILRARSILGNGGDETVGDVDGGRMQQLFDVAVPAFRQQGYSISSGLRPRDIATNVFIDPAIGL